MKECYIPYTLRPQYNRECNELYFFFPCMSLGETKFENYHISNNIKPTTNYKSIHFIMGGKELTDEEIQKFTLKDPKNKIINLYKDNRELLKTHYHLKLVLNGPIDPRVNCTELVLTDVIRTDKEMKYL
jgi:hypothetical protein